MTVIDATIKLFKAVPISDDVKKTPPVDLSQIDIQLLRKTTNKGFIFSTEVIQNYSQAELERIIDTVGTTAREMNNSFHKSWAKVRDADIEQLVTEQIIHYITTYGFEALGIYNKDTVYVPLEELSIPEVETINFVVIKGCYREEIKEKLLALLQSGIALKEDTQKAIIDIALYLNLNETEVRNAKNSEVKVALYSALGIVPSNPVEFLRYLVFVSTGKALLIKNQGTIDAIKGGQNLWAIPLFVKYEKEHHLVPLAKIFLRFKPLFLAFKTNPRLNNYINRIRKLARKHHEAMPQDYLNAVTARIKHGQGTAILGSELDKVNVFRKIRLAQALQYRTTDASSILYRVRNGKGFATEFDFANKNEARNALRIVLSSIEESVGHNVKGKKIYIPDCVEYALPATERAFTENFPIGTCIKADSSILVGVHWQNVGAHRIDLDLSAISLSGAKVGWDAGYRTNDRSVLFSGDLTDAPMPNGASELLYARPGAGQYIVMVNYFNFDENLDVPFNIFIAHENVYDLTRNYTVNPNNVLSIADTNINKKQKIIGLLDADKDCRFYFAETSIGGSISSYSSGYTNNAARYLETFYRNQILLNDVLKDAGAVLVADKEQCDVDLSPEALERDTIIRLLVDE